MPQDPPDPRLLGKLYSLAHIGIEMVVPIALGAWLDDYAGWKPWGVIAGTLLGLAGGFLHLILIVSQKDKKEEGAPPESK